MRCSRPSEGTCCQAGLRRLLRASYVYFSVHDVVMALYKALISVLMPMNSVAATALAVQILEKEL